MRCKRQNPPSFSEQLSSPCPMWDNDVKEGIQRKRGRDHAARTEQLGKDTFQGCPHRTGVGSSTQRTKRRARERERASERERARAGSGVGCPPLHRRKSSAQCGCALKRGLFGLHASRKKERASERETCRLAQIRAAQFSEAPRDEASNAPKASLESSEWRVKRPRSRS